MFGCVQLAEKHQESNFPEGRVFGNHVYNRVLNQFPGRIQNPSDRKCVEELEDFFSSQSDFAGKFRGFKFKFPSQAGLFSEITQHLESLSDRLRVIVLRRNDYLRRAISVMNLQSVQSESNCANVDFEFRVEPAEFDSAEVIRLIKYYQSLESPFSDWPKQFANRLEIHYEELIKHQDRVCESIQDFIGVSNQHTLTSRTRKIAPNDLRTQVSNYDELVEALTSANIELR